MPVGPEEIYDELAISELADAMRQLLDDMGADGHCVCEAAKAQARVALEPFRYSNEKIDYPLETAQAVLREIEQTQ
jgi:hypothetical protein